ncbi:MAG: hypothetical protein ABI114_16550 [Rhodanobacter sp.]
MRARQASLLLGVALTALLTLSACAGNKAGTKRNAPGLTAPIAADFFIPANVFDAKGDRPAAAVPARQPWQQGGTPVPFQPEVLIYFSPASQAYYRKGKLDGNINVVLWERFLKKYNFPYRILASIDDLQRAQSGVLVLPSDVALSERERQLIVQFRQRGGSMFASWLTGVRDQAGAWQGFAYMESLLGIHVAGFTGPLNDDRYINPSGALAVAHSLPACKRIWTERTPGWFPLRVTGDHPAAQMLTWSRRLVTPQVSTAMVFDDTALADGQSSRMVFFGWPERLWMGASPQEHEALLYDSMTWLLRRPDAYLATWPYPYSSAYMPVVYMADIFNDNDMPFAKLLKESGMRGSYFILSHEIDKSRVALKKIQALGHELGYEGDVYEGFKGQPLDEQVKRLDSMRSEIKDNKLEMPAAAGFYPPMDQVDASTAQAILRQPFLYQIVSNSASDDCIPSIQKGSRPGQQAPLVLIPRLGPGAEEMLDDLDEKDAVISQVAELAATDQSGGISIARFANQSLLSQGATHALVNAAVARKDHMWLTSGTQVAHWWLQRARVSYAISGTAAAPQLAVTVDGQGPLKGNVAIWLNLPERGASVQLTPINDAPLLKIATGDADRVALLLRGLTPGRYAWSIRFIQKLDKP